jgi:hydrogenase maturation protein HypF
VNRPAELRLRLRFRGTVQGVGFRPTVHRVATSLGLTGWVINDPLGATAEIEGPTELVEGFVGRLEAELPPLARLDETQREELEPLGERAFEVRTSTLGRREGALVPPDSALCADCREDMESTGDRRYRYPFTTCTNCGPRFTIVRSLPYDRERTSMACFPLCPACRAEYDDPSDRRFHAEPVACPACGPRVWLVDGEGREIASDDPIARARRELLDGRVVAVKALGGFQLACRADDGPAVARLRRRKQRYGKPLAVMVPSVERAAAVVDLDRESEALLASARAPIVLAPRLPGAPIADEVAPGLIDLGVMIPTTPVHVELTREADMPALVMTSGNLSEEPLCRGNREAVDRLRGIADIFLLHDRDIERRVDDSVVRSSESGPIMVRRARGWVPEPVRLPDKVEPVIMAVGGHLQVTGCVTQGDQAFMSQHVGDLESEAARSYLKEVLEGLLDFLQVAPDVVVADAHPDYPSSWLAAEMARAHGAELLEIQHHLAHIAAVLGEHGSFPDPGGRALGLALDGTGWGPDGTAWGGEWIELRGDLGWRRLARLEPLPLVGGERAVREPWRVALAALVFAGAESLIPGSALARELEPERLAGVQSLVGSGSWPLASGAGRVFEAAGALLGCGHSNRFEGELAVRLESLAAAASNDVAPWPGFDPFEADGLICLPSAALLTETAQRAADGEPPAEVAAGFHTTFCALAESITKELAVGINGPIAVGGGCLVNRILRKGLKDRLGATGADVLVPSSLPPGDGGLSYGQAAVAAIAAARGVRPRQLERRDEPL